MLRTCKIGKLLIVKTCSGRWNVVPSSAKVLRRMHHSGGRDGQGRQLDGRQSGQTRSEHHGQLQRQLRARLQLDADRVQQRDVDADPEERAGKVQIVAGASAQRNGCCKCPFKK